ncbi:hypothetical protein ACFFRR_006278 [Megaselia abdita]
MSKFRLEPTSSRMHQNYENQDIPHRNIPIMNKPIDKEEDNTFSTHMIPSPQYESVLQEKKNIPTHQPKAVLPKKKTNPTLSKPIIKTPVPNIKAQKVSITSFIRSNCVYVRDADDETTSRFNLTRTVVEKLSQNLSQIRNLPEEGTFLIVKLMEFKRCTIQEVKGENHIKVFLSDSGRQEFVQMSQLYEPGNRLEKLAETNFIKMLKLENVPEFYLNKKASEYIKYVLSDEVFLELENGSQPDEGRIFDVVKNEYINDVLFCYAQEEEPEMEEFEPEDKPFTYVPDEIFKIDSIPKKELPHETEVSLMIYNNSQLEKNYILSCVNIDDLGEIKEIIRDIDGYGSNNEDKTYKPEEDDLCISFYAKKKKWGRARFIEICEDDPNEAMVCFIDFGKNIRVPLKKIIKYPEAFCYIPNFLFTCRVFGLPQQPNEELIERLYELLPENVSVKAKSLSVVDKNFHLIEMDAVLKILAIEDLI